ncbi:MAG: hypothetical protein ABSB94_08795 [Syntrophorhabdales bacterium]|jgi:hypothetical protein
MDRKPWLSPSLMCCLGLLMVACSLIRSGKANNDGRPAAGQAEPATLSETSSGSAEVAGKEGRERKWENYASDAHGVDYYVERESVAYPSKTLVRAWRKRTFPINSPQKEIIAFDEIDCNEARYRSLKIEGVYWDGRTRTFNVVSPWIRIFTDSPDEVLYLDVCKAARESN